MRLRRRRRVVAVLAVLVACAAALSAYAITASNTVPASNAGSGSSAISGYTATNVSYVLNSSNPQNIDAVTFTLSPTNANTVRARLVSTGSWYACTNTAGSVSCTTTSPQVTAAAADELTVVAAQ